MLKMNAKYQFKYKKGSCMIKIQLHVKCNKNINFTTKMMVLMLKCNKKTQKCTLQHKATTFGIFASEARRYKMQVSI